MSNLIAACVYASNSPFPELIVGQNSHIAREEVGGVSIVARCSTRQLALSDQGAYNLEELTHVLSEEPDIHCPSACAVFLEDTHGILGGKCLPKQHAAEVKKMISQTNKNVALHCDGARIWNAAVAKGLSPSEVADPFDSVSCCLSKGLGAPMGSLLVGSRSFVEQARKFRKMLGGGARQIGVIAAAGIFAIKNNLSEISEDHQRAKDFANELQSASCPRVFIEKPETNICLVQIPKGKVSLRPVLISRCMSDGVRIGPWGENKIRAVFHRSIPKNGQRIAALVIAKHLRHIFEN